MIPSKRLALTALLLTIASATVTASFGLGNPDRLPRCMSNPLLAFETLQSPAEAELIWGQLGDKKPNLARSFVADFGFIAAYTLLFVTLGRIAQVRGVPLGRLAGALTILAAILAGACDVGENLSALKVIAALEGGARPDASTIDAVRHFALTKWGLLGITWMLLWFAFRPGRRGPALYRLNALLAALFFVISGAVSILGVFDNPKLERTVAFLAPAILLQFPLFLAYWDVLMSVQRHPVKHTAFEHWGEASG